MLTRKDFIKKANEFIEEIKNPTLSQNDRIKEYNNYCELAIKSNPRFDIGRFSDYIVKGIYE